MSWCTDGWVLIACRLDWRGHQCSLCSMSNTTVYVMMISYGMQNLKIWCWLARKTSALWTIPSWACGVLCKLNIIIYKTLIFSHNGSDILCVIGSIFQWTGHSDLHPIGNKKAMVCAWMDPCIFLSPKLLWCCSGVGPIVLFEAHSISYKDVFRKIVEQNLHCNPLICMRMWSSFSVVWRFC